MSEKRIVVIPDMQIPSEDRKFVATLTQFVADYGPDELFVVGDESDSPEPSRWAKGTALEYAGTLQEGFDRVFDVMGGFREVIGDRPFHCQRSNHTDRLRTYVNKYASALSSLRSLDIEKQLGYDLLEVTYHKDIWSFAPGWAMAHGDEGSLSQVAGGTALSLARRTGLSIVCGHTHRAGLVHSHAGLNGRITAPLFGMEVGHAMDLSKASYLKTGAANWQQAFGLLTIKDKRVYPSLVPVINKSFIVDGQTYSW